MVLLLVLAFLVIVGIEVPAMMMKEQKGELRTFWVLLGLGFGLSLATVQGWPVPNPTLLLEAIFRPFSLMLGLR